MFSALDHLVKKIHVKSGGKQHKVQVLLTNHKAIATKWTA